MLPAVSLAFEICNLLLAIGFLVLFIVRLIRIRRLSQTPRYLHLYPVYRSIFVVVFVASSLTQIVLLLVTDPAKLSLEDYSQLYLIIGTCINSVVLVFELILMRAEILRERPYSPVHRIYWIYLPIITLARLIFEAVDRVQLEIATFQLVLSAIIFADSLLLCLYSVFLKRQEIREYEHRELFKFDHLNLTLQMNLCSQLQEFTNRERPQSFPLLKVEVQRNSASDLSLRVYSEQAQPLAQRQAVMEQLSDFYTKCCKFDLVCRLNFEEDALDSGQLQQFFDELLADWRNYESFVLEFLGLPQDYLDNYRQRLDSLDNGRCHSVNRQMDPCCLFFSISIFKVMHIRHHLEFFIAASTPKGEIVRQFHKRYTQFEDLDRRLRGIQVREGANELKLRMPELPEKYYLNMQEADIQDRRSNLQRYLQRVCNDRLLLKRYQQSRDIILEYLGITDLNTALPERQPFEAKSISKMIAKNNEPATYYSFIVASSGASLGVICKRFSEFEELHKELKRWMHNSQVDYRSVVLPPKKLKNLTTEKDKQLRHRQLTAYLNILCRDVRQLNDIYEWRAFLGPQMLLHQPRTASNQTVVEIRGSPQEEINSSMNSSRLGEMIDNLGDQNLRTF